MAAPHRAASAPVVRTLESVATWPTDMVELRGADSGSAPSLLAVLVPGNPGAIDFYFHFLEELSGRLGPTAVIVGVSHAGHSPLAQADDAPFTLDDQIAHKETVLDALFQRYTPQKTVLLGHSVGAYINLKVLQRRPDLRVDLCVGLMPTIRHLSVGIPKLAWLGVNTYGSTIVPWLVHWIPVWFKKAVIGLLTHLDALAPTVKTRLAEQLLCFTVLRNVLHMAHTEVQQIIDLEEALVGAHPPARLKFIYSPVDPYTPLPFIDDMCQRFPLVHIERTDASVKHAFVVSAQQCRDMAALVHQHIV